LPELWQETKSQMSDVGCQKSEVGHITSADR
jgi:hypothetical protein